MASEISRRIHDYAITEAKRNGAESVGPDHIITAIWRADGDEFESRFPGAIEIVRQRLSETSGTALKPDGFIDALESELDEVSDVDAMRDFAARLLGMEPVPTSSSRGGTDASDDLDRASASSTADPQPDGIVESPFPDLAQLSLQLNATTDASDLDEKLRMDVVTIIDRVASGGISSVRDQLLTLDSTLTQDPSSGLSSLVDDLGNAGQSALAHQVALSYIDVAIWSASADDDVTEEESDLIDQLRIDLRTRLSSHSDSTDQSFDLFDSKFHQVVGMESTKAELRKRLDYYLVRRRRIAQGLPVQPQSMHMAFVGPPGTGKTTVARLYAEILAESGVLRRGHIVEVDRSGLIAEYVGHTEKKTSGVVDSALGGVLFIDEAYALANDAGDIGSGNMGYGREAIDVLVKRLEDDRDDLVVIFAGYVEPMTDFLGRNEGLRSRVPTTIEFSDYTESELEEIFLGMVERDGFVMDEGTKTKVRKSITGLLATEDFGNARSIRNLYEEIQRNQFSRVGALGAFATRRELSELIESDVPSVESARSPQQSFGFSAR
jgi:SpoVK/Ycf46/Vps4 family AAA+-type ATPase